MEALEMHKQVLSESEGDPLKNLPLRIVAGELERRLGLFDDARARFVDLATREEAKAGVFAEIVKLELSLIEARNAEPQKMPPIGGTEPGK
jgi:hypothetical protein